MTNETDDFANQLEAARKGMDQYRKTLSALVGAEDKSASEEWKGQLEIARKRVEKYRTVYRALAK